MVDKDTKTIDKYIDDSSPSSTYAKRRTVSSDQMVDVMIKEVGVDGDNLILLVDVSDDDYILEFDKNDDLSKDELYNLIVDIEYEDDVFGKDLQVSFNDKMTRFGFEVQDDYPYSCSIVEEDEKSQIISNIDNNIDNFTKEIFYQRESDEDKDWSVEISQINDLTEDKFEIICYLNGYSEIKWEIEVPVTTETEESEVAKLIENQGGGLPNQLSEGGEVNIIHENDIDRHLDYVSVNDKGWVLCVPETFENWVNTDYSKNSDNSTSTTTNTGSISATRSTGNIWKIFIYTVPVLLIEPIFRSVAPAVMKGTEFFEIMMSMTDIMVGIVMIMLPLALIAQVMKSQTRKNY